MNLRACMLCDLCAFNLLCNKSAFPCVLKAKHFSLAASLAWLWCGLVHLQEDYGTLLHVRREFDRRKKAWSTLAEWSAKSHSWMHAPVETINGEDVQREVRQRSCFS